LDTELLVRAWKSTSPVRHPDGPGVVCQEDAQNRDDISGTRRIAASGISTADGAICRGTAILERPPRAHPYGPHFLQAASTGCLRWLWERRPLALNRQMAEHADGGRPGSVAPLGDPPGLLSLEPSCAADTLAPLMRRWCSASTDAGTEFHSTDSTFPETSAPAPVDGRRSGYWHTYGKHAARFGLQQQDTSRHFSCSEGVQFSSRDFRTLICLEVTLL